MSLRILAYHEGLLTSISGCHCGVGNVGGGNESTRRFKAVRADSEEGGGGGSGCGGCVGGGGGGGVLVGGAEGGGGGGGVGDAAAEVEALRVAEEEGL